jgi:hypothetical protein
MLYILARGRWFHIIVLNVQVPSEDNIEDVKDSFYEELECVFDKFPKYHTRILLGDFDAEVGKEDILNKQLGKKTFLRYVGCYKSHTA